MPTENERQLAIAEEKFRQFLILAKEVLGLREQIHQQIGKQTRTLHDSLRDRVLIGLHLKALDSFDRLLADAEDKRPECSHHLKTMAESFIYLGWVSGDKGDTRAKLLCAEGYRSRAVYHELLEERKMATEWHSLQNEALTELETEWRRFRDSSLEQIATEGNRLDQYRMIYRLACEAAHMGDLFTYMPPQLEEPGLRFTDQSLLRTYVCLKFGIILACDLLHDASDALAVNVEKEIEVFRDRWRTIINLSQATDD